MLVIAPDGQLHLSEIQEAKFRVFEQKRFTAPLTFTFVLLFCPLFSLLVPCVRIFRKSPRKYALVSGRRTKLSLDQDKISYNLVPSLCLR